MKKIKISNKRIIPWITLLIIINLIPSTISEKTVNNILYVGCDEIECYPTIQSAIDASKKGDTIIVLNQSSPYNENIVISKQINIIGEDKDTTIINGNGMNSVVYITSDHVNFTNFTIKNGGNNPGIYVNSKNNKIKNCIINSNSIGIKCEYSENNIISLNKIQNNNNIGIQMIDSSNNNINECLIENSDTGIELGTESTNNTIYGNTIRLNENNIYLQRSSLNNIYWNQLTGSNYGIYSEYSSENIYSENIIEKNEFGGFFNHASELRIKKDNIISENQQYGIKIIDSDNIYLNENTINNNEKGIIVEDSSNNDIYWNKIINNEIGINIINSKKVNIYLNEIIDNMNVGVMSEYNSFIKITYNNFIKNNQQSYFIQSSIFSLNIWRNNYWDDWGGRNSYQINGRLEGFFTIDSWNKLDRNPAIEPYIIG
jgi:parallel beta-helix repeat protein